MDTYQTTLNLFHQENRFRSFPHPCPGENGQTVVSNRIIDLTSNDYLALSQRVGDILPSFLDKMKGSVVSPMTSSSSRLLLTRQDIYLRFEEYLESLFRRPALLFNSGYHANVGCLQALADKNTVILADKLSHASIIDGIRLSGAEFQRFPHNDIDNLSRRIEKILSTAPEKRIIVVTESIFSMDGDKAPLSRIVDLKQKYPDIIIYLDEAHAFGVRGEKGLGLAEEMELTDKIDVILCTLGKALASDGAFVITSPLLKDYLINTARSLIFSTALSPIQTAWSHEMVRLIVDMKQEREHLKEISNYFAASLIPVMASKGIDPMPLTDCHDTPIIPLMTRDAEKAIGISTLLRKHGVLALPIRRPTVGPQGERIRFSMNASLTSKDIDTIIQIISLSL